MRYLQNSATHTETILKDKQRDRCEGEYVRWSPFTTFKTQSLLWTQQESLQKPLSYYKQKQNPVCLLVVCQDRRTDSRRDLTRGGAGGERRRGVTAERAEGTSDERGGERDERGTAVCTSRRRCFDCVTTTVWRRICSAASVETGLKLWRSFS